MNQRTALTAADLFVLLEREFRRRKPRECSGCFVQLPYRVDAREPDAPNWEVVFPPSCGRGCEIVLEELAGEFQCLYDLKDGDGDRA